MLFSPIEKQAIVNVVGLVAPSDNQATKEEFIAQYVPQFYMFSPNLLEL
jgi:hypothetical protein